MFSEKKGVSLLHPQENGKDEGGRVFTRWGFFGGFGMYFLGFGVLTEIWGFNSKGLFVCCCYVIC